MNIQTCEYCNVVFCQECDGDEHARQVDGRCVSNTWQHSVVKVDETNSFAMTEDFDSDGFVVLFDAPTLKELENQIDSDYKSMKEAIKRYGN